MRAKSRYKPKRYRAEKMRALQREVQFLQAERKRLEWLLGTALEVAVAGTPTKPPALLSALCELLPTNPARAAVFQERS